MTNQFYVYLNWQANGDSAKVHLAECGHCNHGQGTHPGSTEDHGRWIGPFNSVDEAERTARRERPQTSIRMCGHCERLLN